MRLIQKALDTEARLCSDAQGMVILPAGSQTRAENGWGREQGKLRRQIQRVINRRCELCELEKSAFLGQYEIVRDFQVASTLTWAFIAGDSLLLPNYVNYDSGFPVSSPECKSNGFRERLNANQCLATALAGAKSPLLFPGIAGFGHP
jgi:hypothetical protein